MYFSIRKRMTVTLFLLIVMIAAAISVALYQHTKIAKSAETINTIVSEIELTSHLQLALSAALMPANDYLILGENGLLADKFNMLVNKAESLLHRIEDISVLSDEEIFLLSHATSEIKRMRVTGNEIFSLPDPVGNKRGAVLMTTFDDIGNKTILLLEQLHNIYEDKLTTASKLANDDRQKALFHLIGSGTLIGVLILIFSMRFVQSIIKPIRALAKGTRFLESGEWGHRVNIKTGDELEVLGNHFNQMAENLGQQHSLLEREVEDRTCQLTERVEDLATLLKTSTELSSELELDQLLSMMAERLTNTLKVTYCRIALIDEDNPDPIIRAAFPIRMINWEPGIGRVLEPYALPDIRHALETSQCVILSHQDIVNAQDTLEISQILTPETESALIVPLMLKGKIEGIVILGEARVWEREPFSSEKISICQTLINQAATAIANAKSHANLQDMFMSTVSAMSSAIDAKSPWTRGHSERMTDHAVKIAQTLGLDDNSLNNLRLGCLLHDIGKIGTYESILNKPGRLTDDEMDIMKQHPSIGEAILKPIRQFKEILPVVRHHHERFDGKGYPDGLAGEDIPLLARIAAIADTYDAMTADRPYRKGCNIKDAIDEIKRHAGTQFDTNISNTFIHLLENGYQ